MMSEIEKFNKIKKDRNAWKQSVDIVASIQIKLPHISKTKEIILALLETNIPLIDMNDLSIIYKSFGKEDLDFLAYSGEIFSNNSKPLFQKNNPNIIETMNSNNFLYFENETLCKEAGFGSYKSVLIVPMRLDNERNMGVFIIHNTHKEYHYEGDIPDVLNKLSDRITYFIHEKTKERLHHVFDEKRNNLLSNKLRSEYDIFFKLIELMKNWYVNTNDIYILIRSSIEINNYFNACDKGIVNKNFRLNKVLSSVEKKNIIGNDDFIKLIDKNGSLVLKKETDLKKINNNCKSFVATDIKHPSGYNFGYIIIQNLTVEKSYDNGDDNVLDNISDFTAVLLEDYRNKKRYDFIKEIEKSTKDLLDRNIIYNNIYDIFYEMYGVRSLEISIKNKKKQQLNNVFRKGYYKFNFSLEDYKKIDNHIQKLRDNLGANAKNLTLEINENNYLVTPMRVVSESGIWQVLGCFIIPIQETGNITANAINKVSDALATKMHHWSTQKRNKIINNFGKKVSQLSTTSITEKKLLRLAYEAVERVMFSENFYIATYDPDTNKIRFPFSLKGGKSWDLESRSLNSDEIGKTEEILLTGQPLLHLTKEGSKAWYTDLDHPERKEFVGNYLASWVGVPIFSTKGVIGVIATYHSTENYLYANNDIFFLQNIASSISALFRLLQESKTKNEIERIKSEKVTALIIQAVKEKEEKKKQAYIAEQQDLISTSLLAQDLTHRLNNSIGIIKISVEQAIRDISLTQQNGRTKHLRRTKQSLTNIDEVINEVIDEISEISRKSLQKISLRDIIDKVLRQVSISKRLAKENIEYSLNIADDVPHSIEANMRTFFNSLYAVVENSANAVLKKKELSPLISDFFVDINITKNGDDIFIDISDNGVEISKSRRNEIFQVNPNAGKFSRYGLWRARNIIESLGGSLELLDSKPKTFRFIISEKLENDQISRDIVNKKNIVYILDDEVSWRDQIGWWLEDINFTVRKAKNQNEMNELLNINEVPQLILLDISLYKREGRNVDGLVFIEKFRKKYSQVKICIITGYTELLGDYKKHVDYVFKKVDNETRQALEQEYFTKKIKELINS